MFIKDLEKFKSRIRGSAVSVGVFDALHKGHVALLRRLVSVAKREKLPSVVVTFDPYPREVLSVSTKMHRLMLKDEKVRLLHDIGVDHVAILRFSRRISRLTPDEFIREHLIGKLGMRCLVVGEDFAMGKGASGGRDFLKGASLKFGFRYDPVRSVRESRKIVKTSLIRRCIDRGDVAGARKYLGRPYSIEGVVVPSKGRGKRIGFPTANIMVPAKLIPLEGIYATICRVGGNTYPSITYIGNRPTFPKPKLAVETHIYNFKRDIYQQNIRIEFYGRVRSDRKFKDASFLQKQISKDIRKAKRMVPPMRALFHSSKRGNNLLGSAL